MLSGPWSLDWMHDLNQGDVGVIFSARKKPVMGASAVAGRKKGGQDDRRRRKAGWVFRHTLSSLKKVARLPSKDRGEVLKILKKSERRRKDGSGFIQSRVVSSQVSSDVAASSASVTNDWKHWVVMHGGRESYWGYFQR
ncbi:hypothetical protein TSUD_59520 [Trifolium subterraneum]|uniref:DUF4283 domain-containing protein n=1 Tax=Trifolium subterraneum TaxID=3900 RepID=A0A2Z6MAS9_TRISU|nr:hypothetical protein TSUD_59520 [Trifolium subterraneum]